jgi:hypothetical protein
MIGGATVPLVRLSANEMQRKHKPVFQDKVY